MPVSQRGAAARHDRKLTGILAAAAEVFAEEGYDRATIRRVGERAGVSVPGIYHYVRSKEELLFLIQNRVFRDLVQRFKTDSRVEADPATRLEILVRNHLERFLSSMAELVVCSREIDRLKGSFLERVQSRQREYFALARGLFDEIADLHGGARVDPRTAALALFGTINWIHTWYRPGQEASASRLARDFVRLCLRGVLPDEGHDAPRGPGP